MTKTKQQTPELSYYGLYLFHHLKENHPDKAADTTFLNERADHAAEVYEQARLAESSPEGAQEFAMAALLSGLHFSKYNTIIEVIWNEFWNEVEPGNAATLARQLLAALETIFSAYPLSDDFASSPEYDLLYTELTGAIALHLEAYGI